MGYRETRKAAILPAGLRLVHDLPSNQLVFKGFSYTWVMQRLWLIFAQAVTLAVAVLFVVSTFRPEWLPARSAL